MKPASVYVHFPWCLAKCPYCDFTSYATKPETIPHDRYADAVIQELRARVAGLRAAGVEYTIGTVFFGGGTPSLWKAEALGRVLAAIREELPTVEDLEVTAECNPTSLDRHHADALAAVGVNRASIGTQSLREEELKFLGRLHDSAGASRAVADALASTISRVSTDLIFGLAGQDPADAELQATTIAEAGVGHLSCYQLTIEAGTRFGELAKVGRLPMADDGRVAEAFLRIDAALEARGFRHYEISNYAKPGQEARHNLGYWRGEPYLGLGCGAVGCLETDADGQVAVRGRNPIDPEKYMQLALDLPTGLPTESDGFSSHFEVLDGETRLRERIMLGLRLADGFDLRAAAAPLGVDPWPAERKRAAEKLVAQGKLVVDGDRLTIPRPGWLFADDTAARLF
jgi:oxygen-independent coproporphyrinogen-3 oxidase